MSKSTGIPLSTLASYAADKKATYSAAHIGQLCDYFKVSADFLLFGTETNENFFNSLATEDFFSGWVKIKIERPLEPLKKEKKKGL